MSRFCQITWTCSLAVATTLTIQAAEETPPIAFKALTAFDKLPLLTDWPAFQDSSYHRDDINQDAGNFLRVEANGDQVLTDTDGPGVVYRIWSTGVVGRQMSQECRLRFYFDGEAEPRLNCSMPELFGAEGSRWPFVPPLAVTFESGRGPGEGPCNLCYVPIPFAKHLKIVGRNVMFYHVDYQKLSPETAIESFSIARAEAHRAVIDEAAAQFNRVGTRPGAISYDDRRTLKNVTLPPGEACSLRLEGTGMIGEVWINLAERTGVNLRGIVLEIAFEKDGAVCVRVPLGDFFGSGCGDRRFKSIPTGMTEDGYYAYWPMPFRRLATVALRNDTTRPVSIDTLRVSWFQRPQAMNAGYFHARYVQDPNIPLRQDYRILAVQGRGKFVGTNVTMQNARGAQGIFYLEGDEKIYVDGESYPSRWLGTGAEDYFNGAYFWNAPNKAAMARPYGGLTFLDWGIGRVCAYRWHVTDFISFRKQIQVDLEHGGVSDWPANYQSVAYYYLEKPTPQGPLPALTDRLPRTPLPPAPTYQCCTLAGTSTLGTAPLEKRTFSAMHAEYESADTVLYGEGSRGEGVDLTVDVPGEDLFTVVLNLSGGPNFGALDVSLNAKRLGRVDARKPTFTPWFQTELGQARLSGGTHTLRLTLAKDSPRAENLALGLVALQLKPHSRLIDQWYVCGNWPCPKDGGWTTVNEPERRQDLPGAYKLPDGRTASWREHTGERVGLAGGNWRVAYGLTYIHSPEARSIACFIAKDDGLKLWINDEIVFDQYTWSHAWLDQFFCTVRLQQGWNKVLVKCANWDGGWGFALRPGDPDRKLTFARQPE